MILIVHEAKVHHFKVKKVKPLLLFVMEGDRFNGNSDGIQDWRSYVEIHRSAYSHEYEVAGRLQVTGIMIMCSLEEKGYRCTRDEMDFISHSHSRRDNANDDTLSATVNNATGLAKLNPLNWRIHYLNMTLIAKDCYAPIRNNWDMTTIWANLATSSLYSFPAWEPLLKVSVCAPRS